MWKCAFKMTPKCPKCDHENSTVNSVKQVAECSCDCHKTHSF